MSSALKRRMDRLSPPSGKAFSRNFRGGTEAELDAYLERIGSSPADQIICVQTPPDPETGAIEALQLVSEREISPSRNAKGFRVVIDSTDANL